MGMKNGKNSNPEDSIDSIGADGIGKNSDSKDSVNSAEPRVPMSTSTQTSMLMPEAFMFQPSDFEVDKRLGSTQLQKQADEEVQSLVGMSEAKEWFKELKKKVAYVEKTGDRTVLKTCLNMVITGNPGTGKTTFVAKLVRFLTAYGLLSKGTFVSKNALELKGEYVGETCPKVREAVAEAMGGCLFLDEAYALADSGGSGPDRGGDGFSREAVRSLLTEVENNRTSLMVVLAGYKQPMARMLRLDPGLERRFAGRLHLPDYTPAELAHIAEGVARERFQKEFEPGLRDRLAQHIEHFHHRDISQQNGGLSVNLVERAVQRQAARVVDASDPTDTRESLRARAAVLNCDDFAIHATVRQLGDPALQAAVEAEVESLVGLDEVQAFFETMKQRARYVERGGDPKTLRTSLNMVITGNPGTGKTTIARKIARYLHAFGVLPTDRFVERNGLEMKGQYVGQTAPTVKAAIADAMGGCLFLDEAYALVNDEGGVGDTFSGEAIRMFLTEVENNRTNLLVIMAGYRDKMELLMDSDPGLRRRFSMTLHLPDYTAGQLSEIAMRHSSREFGLAFEAGLRESLREHIWSVHGFKGISQQNAGLAINLMERAMERMQQRVVTQGLQGTGAQTLIKSDFLISNDNQPFSPSPDPQIQAQTQNRNEPSSSSSCGDAEAAAHRSRSHSPLSHPHPDPEAEDSPDANAKDAHEGEADDDETILMGDSSCSLHSLENSNSNRSSVSSISEDEKSSCAMNDRAFEPVFGDDANGRDGIMIPVCPVPVTGELNDVSSAMGCLMNALAKQMEAQMRAQVEAQVQAQVEAHMQALAGSSVYRGSTGADQDIKAGTRKGKPPPPRPQPPIFAIGQFESVRRTRERARTRTQRPKHAENSESTEQEAGCETSEEEDEDNDAELTAAMVQAALDNIGRCQQGYAWDRRDAIRCACQKCGESGRPGWQCKGGTHWVCRSCIKKEAKRKCS